MSKILAIDSLNNSISVAIIVDNKILLNFNLKNIKTHSEELMPIIDNALKFSNLNINQVDKIITTNGPGSFTGIRITLSCIKALAHPTNIPIYATSSIRAASYLARYYNGAICPIMDARRNQVYACAYEKEDEIIKEKCWNIDDLLEELKDKNVIFIGEAVEKFSDRIINYSKTFRISDEVDYNSYALGAYLAYKNGFCKKYEYTNLEANYLRIPQAQRELEERNEI